MLGWDKMLQQEKPVSKLTAFADCADRQGDIVVVLLEHTMLRGAMHILETYMGFLLVDHVIMRRKSNGTW